MTAVSSHDPSPRRPVFRVRTLPDLLAMVPVVLGFEPQESLVVAAVAGTRPGFQLRVDLPPPSSGDLVAGLCAQVTSAVRSQACTRVAVLGFSADVGADDTLRAVADALSGAGLDVVDVVRADGSRYWSLVCADPRCCPPAGVAYDPRSNLLRAEAALAGINVAPDRDAVASRLAACSGQMAAAMRTATAVAEREVVAALGLRGRSALAEPSGDLVRRLAPAAAARCAERVDGLLDRVLGRLSGPVTGPVSGPETGPVTDAVTDAEAAGLSVWCSIVCLRDLAWSRIDRASADRHLVVWSAVGRRVVAPYEPAVLSLAGFAAWMAGDGASAWCAVDRALAADPGYSMARLLGDALAGCVPPDAWTPPPRAVVLASIGAGERADWPGRGISARL